ADAAWLADDLPLAAADRAGGRDHQEALRVHDLAAPAAVLADLRLGAGLSARAAAGAAGRAAQNLDLLGHAGGGLDQRDVEPRLDVGAAAGGARAPRAAVEDVAEDVREGGEDVAHVAEPLGEAGPRTAVPVAIVERTLLRITQDLVGLGR